MDRFDFGPVVDGTVLPGHPFDPAATAVSADIPVLLGGVRDEMAIFLAPDGKVWEQTLSVDELPAHVVAVAGSPTDRAVETYHRLFPAATPAERLISILRDANFRVRSFMLAARRPARPYGATRSNRRHRCWAAGSKPSMRSTCRSCSRP